MNLRNADHLQVPRLRLTKTERGFRVSAIRLWTSLPCALRNRTCISSFKVYYKREYFPLVRADFNVTLYNTNNSYLLYRFRLGFTTLNVDLWSTKHINHACVTAQCTPDARDMGAIVLFDSTALDVPALVPRGTMSYQREFPTFNRNQSLPSFL
jgi:hypothetical protein